MNRHDALQNLSTSSESPLFALLTLGRIGTDEDLKVLIPFTSDDRAEIKLIAQGSVSAIIKRILTEKSNSYSELSLKKLGHLLSKADPLAIHEIKHRLLDDPDNLDTMIIKLLKYIHVESKDEFCNHISTLLVSSNDKVRATAATIVGNFFDPKNKSVFTDIISDPDPRVRANAVEMIEELGDERLFFLLFRLKNDPHNRVRANAIKALYAFGRERVLEDLRHMLSSSDTKMQASALWVVSELDIDDNSIKNYCRRHRSSDDITVANQAEAACFRLEFNRQKKNIQKE